MSKLIIAALLISVTSGVEAQVVGASSVNVTIRTYKYTIRDDDFRTARRLAGEILLRAGISVSWVQCWSIDRSSPTSAACALPQLPNEVFLRMLGRPRLTLKISAPDDAESPNLQTSLGFSYVDLHARAGLLATVFSDRVRDLCRGTGVNTVTLLARAIAHEIGHLLLGTARHAANGLMRPVWSRAEVRRNLESDWRFSDAEGQAMKNAIDARVRRRSIELVAGRMEGAR